MKKRLVAALSAFAVAATVLAGCAKPASEPPKTGGTDTAKKLKVGLVTDQGGANDGSFNESADRGIKNAAKELGIERLNPIESKQQEQYQPNLKTMAGTADLVVGAGFMMMESMKEISKQVSDKKFLIVDAVVENPNVASFLFKEHEGSFLAGVMAGMLTKTNKIGFIGGKEGDVIGRFESGFIAGVAATNPEAAKGLMPKDAKSHGQFVKYIDDFSDQSKAKEAANMLYNSGADIIFHAAGGAGEGLFKAAQEKKLWAIGVDSDQAITLPAYKDVLLFSMIKKVDAAVLQGIKDLKDNKFPGGKLVNLGIKEDGVGISETVHANVTAEAKDLAKKAEAQIKEGKIVVPGTLEELLKFQAPALK
ncbi:BMP family lipoprotein [Clostridium polynesiense]|uniref:BMP family lipoprotein n=1 Tax=Clostridium polynesiense TaxID=1325933 RepID=UPI0009E31E3D|nr:BMP family ABC transporter substrate-binding protein [Clostridium polynesiense]